MTLARINRSLAKPPFARRRRRACRLHAMSRQVARLAVAFAVFLGPLDSIHAQSWTQAFPATSPSPRSNAAAGAGDVGTPMVLFGGRSGTVALGDTWSWSGSRWQTVATATAPSARSGAAMAYDRVRRRFVLFGGQNGTGARLADTWSFDGTNWTQLQPTTSPSPRSLAAACYERPRDRVILFGGLGATGPLGDTWAWNGTNWQQLPMTGPMARSGASMAFDAENQLVTMFGGLGPTGLLRDTCVLYQASWGVFSSAGPLAREGASATFDSVRNRVLLVGGRATGGTVVNDAWEWDGGVWSSVSSPATARADAAVAFDATAAQTVLFGGQDQTGPLADTHLRTSLPTPVVPLEWRRVRDVGPAGRSSAAMTFDSARGVSLLFGGDWVGVQPFPPTGSSTSGYFADFWSWDGSSWTQLPAGPSARSGHAMCFDSVRSRVVLFGGAFAATSTSTTYLRDTWEWNGTSWALRNSFGPTATYGGMSAFDSARGVTVYFGGFSPTGTSAQTWEWNGSAWTLRAPASSPPPTWAGAAAFDATRGRTVVFGGLGTVALSDETWEWDGTSWTQVMAQGAPAMSGHDLEFDTQRGVLTLRSHDALRSWDRVGNAWVERAELQAMPRNGFVSTYDSLRNRLVMFGGRSMLSPQFVNQVEPNPTDTWERTVGAQPLLAVTGSSIEFGAPCTAEPTRFVPYAGYRPAPGGMLIATVEHVAPATPTWVALGLSDSTSNAGALPLPLAAINLPGCTLLQSADIDLAQRTTPFASRRSSFRLRIPDDPVFVGLVLFGQSWGISWNGTPALTVSNAIEWRIGSH